MQLIDNIVFTGRQKFIKINKGHIPDDLTKIIDMKKAGNYNQVLTIYGIIGQNIIRRRGSMTQAELAKKAHVSRATISAIENGGPISLSNLISIAEALGIHPGDLFISENDRHEVGIKTKLLLQKVYESFNPNKKED